MNRGNNKLHLIIKMIRELKMMSREQVASEINMSVSGYSKLERGETEITVNRLIELSEVLGVDLFQYVNKDVQSLIDNLLK